MVQSIRRNGPDAPTDLSGKRIEVYLDACSIRGTLETTHARVSDHLGATEEVLRLVDARVVLRPGEVLESGTSVLINKSIILFVVDLSRKSTGTTGFLVERAPCEVMLNIGTIWICGTAHLPVGGEPQSYFSGSMNRFMPVTNATVVGHEAAEPRTVLINRDQLRCMLLS